MEIHAWGAGQLYSKAVLHMPPASCGLGPSGWQASPGHGSIDLTTVLAGDGSDRLVKNWPQGKWK